MTSPALRAPRPLIAFSVIVTLCAVTTTIGLCVKIAPESTPLTWLLALPLLAIPGWVGGIELASLLKPTPLIAALATNTRWALVTVVTLGLTAAIIVTWRDPSRGRQHYITVAGLSLLGLSLWGILRLSRRWHDAVTVVLAPHTCANCGNPFAANPPLCPRCTKRLKTARR